MATAVALTIDVKKQSKKPTKKNGQPPSENGKTGGAPAAIGGSPVAASGKVSVAALARECGSNRSSVSGWLKAEGYDPLNLDPASHDDYVRIIKEHQVSGRESVAALVRECGSDRFSVNRWLKAEGYDPLNLAPAFHDDYVRIIKEHQAASTAPGMPGKKAGRDKDGLTWLEAVQKQDARRKKRENDIADKVLKEEWLSASAHYQILSNLTAKLETAPDKIKTELGLTIGQRDRIQKILDELRFDAAAETRRAFAGAKKKVEEAKTG